MKRSFDFILVLSSLIFMLPVILVLSLIVRIKLGSPIFFRQLRPGKNGLPFEIIKFRTMTNERDVSGDLLPDAERLTKFSKFLRSSSLDELPELWNVLKGDMSLVGPRPLLVEYMPFYSKEQLRRHEVRPGVTGWAQVNGRNTLSWEEKFILDIWYVKNCSILLDVKIIILTVIKVVKSEGVSPDDQIIMPKFTGSKN